MKQSLHGVRLVLFCALVLIFLSAFIFFLDGKAQELKESGSTPEMLSGPSLSIKLEVLEEPDCNGAYMQNFNSETLELLVDTVSYHLAIYINNSGDVDLLNVKEKLWCGERISESTLDRISAGKAYQESVRGLGISEKDVERGYMVIRIEVMADSSDPAFPEPVTCSDEIRINVCPRPGEQQRKSDEFHLECTGNELGKWFPYERALKRMMQGLGIFSAVVVSVLALIVWKEGNR